MLSHPNPKNTLGYLETQARKCAAKPQASVDEMGFANEHTPFLTHE